MCRRTWVTGYKFRTTRRGSQVRELTQREDAQDDVQTFADESMVVEEQVGQVGRDDDDDEYTSTATSRVDRATRHAFTAPPKTSLTTTTKQTTPTTKGWRSDVSFTVPGWSVTSGGAPVNTHGTSAPSKTGGRG